MTSRTLELLDRNEAKKVREFVGPTSVEHILTSKVKPARFCYPSQGQYREPFSENCSRFGREEDGCCVVDEEFLANVFVVANNIEKYDMRYVMPVYRDIVKWCLSRKEEYLRNLRRSEITFFLSDKYAYDLLKLIANTPTLVTFKERCYEDDELSYYNTRYYAATWHIVSHELDTAFRNMLEKCGTIHDVHEATSTLLSLNPLNYPFSFQKYTVVNYDYNFRQRTNILYDYNLSDIPGVDISDIPLVIKDDRFACTKLEFDVRCYIRSSESFDHVVKDILLAMKASNVRRIEVLLNSRLSQVGLPDYSQIPSVVTHAQMKAILATAFRLFMNASGFYAMDGGYSTVHGEYLVKKQRLEIRPRIFLEESYSISKPQYTPYIKLEKDTSTIRS